VELSQDRRIRPRRDEGIVLVLTLVLTVVAGMIALALSSYAATALGTSSVTDHRIAQRSAAAGAIEFVADALATTDAAQAGESVCAEVVASVDDGFWTGGVTAELTCAVTSAGDPMVLVFVATSGSSSIEAVIEVRAEAVDQVTGWHPVAVTTWSPSPG
jgi:Tfp pilus assembly protein PilX